MREHFSVMPRIEALAVVHGDQVCTNEDLIRNSAYNWLPMVADEIRDKTGIEQRLYTSSTLEEIAKQVLDVWRFALGCHADDRGGGAITEDYPGRPDVADLVRELLHAHYEDGPLHLASACVDAEVLGILAGGRALRLVSAYQVLRGPWRWTWKGEPVGSDRHGHYGAQGGVDSQLVPVRGCTPPRLLSGRAPRKLAPEALPNR